MNSPVCTLAFGLTIWFSGLSVVFSEEALSEKETPEKEVAGRASAYEGFAYPTGALDAAAGGRGWKTDGWKVESGAFTIADDALDLSALKNVKSPSSPEHLSVSGTATAIAARQLARPLALDAPGDTYFSFFYRFTGVPGRLIVSLAQNKGSGGASQLRLERSAGSRRNFSASSRIDGIWKSTAAPPAATGSNNAATQETGLVVARLTVLSDSQTRWSQWTFRAGDTLPSSPDTVAPTSTVERAGSGSPLNWLLVSIQAQPEGSTIDLDEFRLGTSWQAVTGK